MIRRLAMAAVAASLASCAAQQAEQPATVWVSAPEGEPQPGAPASPASTPTPPRFTSPMGCTIAKSLAPQCRACVHDRCCDPPVAYSQSLARALECRRHCREPMPEQQEPFSDDDRTAVMQACVGHCNDLHPDSTQDAAVIDRCLTSVCRSECEPRP